MGAYQVQMDVIQSTWYNVWVDLYIEWLDATIVFVINDAFQYIFEFNKSWVFEYQRPLAFTIYNKILIL